jgi:hypothetical protein
MESDAVAPSSEQMKAELAAAGWEQVKHFLWKAPVGGYFIGPYGAWKAMKRRMEAENANR